MIVVLALLNHSELYTSNQTFKNGALVVSFPLYTHIHSMDLTIVSLVGITTRRAETIVWYYQLMTAPSYV